jgi:hypothetical protein
MPGGLLSLVCYGNENVILSGNPQITWFYKSFVRYTHFSQEPIQIPLEGPNVLLMDAPILMKAKIPRQGDLLSDLVLRFELPEIYSKAYIREGQGGDLILDRKHEFAWVRQIGVRLIDTVTFTIGGQKIQEFTSDWISARALLDYDVTAFQKWRYMVGDTPELFDPANGIYADPSGGGYPNVVKWRASDVQNNAPSIPGRIIRVPLGLWFSDYIANSLPLVALQAHDAEIQIKMRPIRDLYTVLDPNGVRLRSGTTALPYLPTDQYTSVWDPALFGTLPTSLNNLYGSYVDLSGSMRHFLTDFGSGVSNNVPSIDGWPLNATLEATYTFLTQKERTTFAKQKLRYNIRQVQNYIFSGAVTRNSYRLDVHNIATRVAYFARRSDAIPYRNQHTNLTNWMYPQGVTRPFVTPTIGYPQIVRSSGQNIQIGRSGLNIPGLRRQIMRTSSLKANGQQLFEPQDPDYFTAYVPSKYLKGNAMPFQDFGLASQSEMWPIHTYSFALHGSEADQPTGTLNTSRINRLEIDIDVEDIPILANYAYEIQIFVETLNFLDITSGLGGLKFAL